MILRITFDENGMSNTVRRDGSLFRIIDGSKVPISGDPDIYDVEPSQTGRYKKVGGVVSPVTQEESFEELPYGQKRLKEYHPMADLLDSLLKSIALKPAIQELFADTPFMDEVNHHQAVKAKYPKP